MFGQDKDVTWEQETIRKLLMEHIREQRRSRRWSFLFRLLFVCVFFVLPAYVLYQSNPPIVQKNKGIQHAAVVDIVGPIMYKSQANSQSVNASLRDAFMARGVKGVILRINSPGGSPVQSSEIHDEILRLKELFPNVKVYAAIEDSGNSGAYLVATAADEIYANKTSLVGSIGVRLDSFGFVGLMEKIGIERRFYSAGDNKGFLDPFSPAKRTDEEFLNVQLKVVHDVFIDYVKKGRGERLNITNDLFSGYFWIGTQAKDLGLIDGFMSVEEIARDVVDVNEVIDYSKGPGLIDKFFVQMQTALQSVIVH